MSEPVLQSHLSSQITDEEAERIKKEEEEKKAKAEKRAEQAKETVSNGTVAESQDGKKEDESKVAWGGRGGGV